MGAPGVQTPYERGMAQHLLEAGQQHPQARVLVLVGNLHARRAEWTGSMGRPTWRPIAMHLPQDELLTFDLGYQDGEVFNCSESGCGPSRVASNDSGLPRVELSSSQPAYNGIWAVGPLSASPPLGAHP